MRITPVGDSALRIELGTAIDEATQRRVQAVCGALEAAALPGLCELVPGYATVLAHYDPCALAAAGAPTDDLAGWLGVRIEQALARAPEKTAGRGRVVEIPVCYGGECGPDLAAVAAHTRLSADEVVRLHQRGDYLVYVVGFAPGFPYMGKIAPQLAMPRRTTPRTAVPPGSVGIVNDQTCVYPLATPGGWNLIGRTPLKLFSTAENPPALLRAGDRVKFRAISAAEFARMEAQR
jgi:inhibitor of KinA